MDKNKLFFIFTMAMFSVYLISSITVTSQIFSVEPNVEEQYVITIDNSDIWPDGNITRVNITLQDGLVYLDGTNETTSTFETFRNDSNVLVWKNNTANEGYLINGTESKEFRFTANGSIIGEYNITILLYANSTHEVEYNSTVKIEDVTDPTVSFLNPTPNPNSNIAQTFIPVNVTAMDSVGIKNITIYIYDSSGLIGSASSDTSPFFLNFTALPDGRYLINATANDTYGNEDKNIRIITLNHSSTECSPNWENCTTWSTCANQNQTRICSDLNVCNTTIGNNKTQFQSCGDTNATIICTPNWDCDNWKPSKCKEGETQEKTCTDLNACDGNNPENTIRNCVVSGGSLSMVWIASIGGVIFFIILIVIIFYIKGRMSLGSSLSNMTSKRLPIAMPKINFPRRNIKIPRLPRRAPMNAPVWASKKPIRRPPQRLRKPPQGRNPRNKPL